MRLFSAFRRRLIAVANPSLVAAGQTSQGTRVNTTSTTVSMGGGTAPFTYSWTKLTGDANWIINSPTAATTSFSGLGPAVNTTNTATFVCTVTDSLGETFVSNTVTGRILGIIF